MFFFFLSNTDIQFDVGRFMQRLYITAEALFITKGVKLIDKKAFVIIALDNNFETFVIYVAIMKASKMTIHLFQIAQVAFLQVDKAFTKISFKYLDYTNVFSTNLAMELPKYNGMNDYAIKMVKNKQPPYKLIYSLSQVELETLKTYI